MRECEEEFDILKMMFEIEGTKVAVAVAKNQFKRSQTKVLTAVIEELDNMEKNCADTPTEQIWDIKELLQDSLK